MEEQDARVGGNMKKPNPNFQRQSSSPGSASGSQNKRSRAIRWDEETIALHDQERGTRQKIDEPPTPYRYSSESDVESGSEKDGSVFGSPPNSNAGVMSEWSNLHAKLTYERYLQMQQEEQRGITEMGSMNESDEGMNVDEPVEIASVGHKSDSPLKPSLAHNALEHHLHHGQHHVFILGDVDTGPEKDTSHNEFVHKRAAHYNEFKVLKALRDKHSDTDDDNDDRRGDRPLKSAIFHHDHHNPHHVQVSEDMESDESEKEEQQKEKEKHNEFVNKRANHYNEFLMIKAMRQQMESEGEGEDENDNDNENENETANLSNGNNSNHIDINNLSENCESNIKRLSIGTEH